jgi:hypothetical protein
MTKASHSLSGRIAAVERRLERRRTRLFDNASESTLAASQAATKVVPVAAAAAAGLAALYLMKRRATTPPPPPRYSDYRAFREQYADPSRRGLRWAQVLGLIGTAVRIGSSPQLRAFWHGFQRARQRRA